jgi:hypothetical protein
MTVFGFRIFDFGFGSAELAEAGADLQSVPLVFRSVRIFDLAPPSSPSARFGFNCLSRKLIPHASFLTPALRLCVLFIDVTKILVIFS